MSVNVGMTSKPGNASSTKFTTAAIFPGFPLYSLVIIHADSGAQIMSTNSPIPGKIKDIIPIASNKMLNASFLYLFIFQNFAKHY